MSNGLRALAWTMAGAACSGQPEMARRWPEEPGPPLVVEVSASAVEAAGVRPAGRMRAPVVRLAGLVQPDPHHVVAITAPGMGTILDITPLTHVRPGSAVARYRLVTPSGGRETGVTASDDGSWHPLKQPGQFVWSGDTLGLLYQHGYWLVVGTLYDYEGDAVHPGDRAQVRLEHVTGPDLPARVEWVRTRTSGAYWSEVAVEFRSQETFEQVPRATVLITPHHPGDSVPAVPAPGVVQLAGRAAVFIPMEGGRYHARWITPGVTVGGMTEARSGIPAGTPVVVSGLEPLAIAARESIAVRERVPRRR